MWIISVKEQAPTGESIYCGVTLNSSNGAAGLTYGANMYFVCDLNRNITQYFSWLKTDYKKQLKKLGYRFASSYRIYRCVGSMTIQQGVGVVSILNKKGELVLLDETTKKDILFFKTKRKSVEYIKEGGLKEIPLRLWFNPQDNKLQVLTYEQ